MTWVAVGVTSAGVVAGVIGGNKSRKQEKQLREQEIALQRESLAFSKKRYDENQALYGETKQKLVNAANEGVTADLTGVTNRASADVAQSFQKSQEETDRNLSRYGINPNSGRAMAAHTGDATNKAVAEAGLVNTSRRNEQRYADDTTWNRRESVSRMGVAELAGEANAVSGAYNGLSGAYGQGANRAGASADAAYGMAGQFAGMGISAALRPGTQPTQAPTPPALLSPSGNIPYAQAKANAATSWLP